MSITYRENGTAEIKMSDYPEEAIIESGLNVARTAAIPARRDLFEVDESAKPLAALDAEVFHSVIAKLLYVLIQARPDILLAVSFLCTRVSKSTTEGQGKLQRVLEYMKGTTQYNYVLGADSMNELRSWVDTSYAVHPDMRSHTGGVMSFGTYGLVCKSSSKQKLNTQNSTETEVVGASNFLPNTMRVQMFLAGQSYTLEKSALVQDNEIAMKLEKNGRMSAGQKSRHIHTRYFWINDRTVATGIIVRHCPTLEMLADFFTKPLQGNLIRRFRDVILRHSHVSTLQRDPVVPFEERVGERRPCKLGTAPSCATSDKDPVNSNGKQSRITWADVGRGSITAVNFLTIKILNTSRAKKAVIAVIFDSILRLAVSDN
jgi:hypothetical protein